MSDSISPADPKAAMDTILTDLSTLKQDMTTMKGDRSCLSMAVNRLQSEKLKAGGSHNPPTSFASRTTTSPQIRWSGCTRRNSFSASNACHRRKRCGLPPSTWRMLPKTGSTAGSITAGHPRGQTSLSRFNAVSVHRCAATPLAP